jgi:hypothetical protein
VARFDGLMITSDAGGLLLRELDDKLSLTARFAAGFTDHRDPGLIEHSVLELIKQRVFALALGYEDLNDHDRLRDDPLLALLVGKRDLSGDDRSRERDRGHPLAGKSTLNRLELTPPGADADSRYKKITADCRTLERFFVDVFLDAHETPPAEIVLDFDATDDPLHGHQLGRFFHGYYKEYCYLPLYVFCGDHLLCAKLRPADIDASRGTVEELQRLVPLIRQRWPEVQIVIRGDSGFCREPIMHWCEENGVKYILGLAKNSRLVEAIAWERLAARLFYRDSGEPARLFAELRYQTRTSWSRERRVVAKAEHLAKGENPRFVVTNLTVEEADARTLYEDHYCLRGEMENRIKEQQLCLFADRTSCATMRANQLRLWFSSLAYVLLDALRRQGLRETDIQRARCDTIRLRVLKIGAQVRVTCRKVWLSLSEAYPYRELFIQVWNNIRQLRPPPVTA